MAQAESNRVDLRFSAETVWNETPSAPTMASLPYTSETLAYDKGTIKSNIVRADRLTDDIIEVSGGSGGEINFEYKFSDFEKLIEGALGSTFVTQTTTGAGTAGNLDFALSSGGTQVITGPSNWTTNYVVGAYVKVSGANAANNGVWKITAKTSTTLTVANSAGTLQTSTTAVVLMKYARTGTAKKSFLLEKSFGDITQFISFRGQRVAHWAMNVEAEQIVTGTFGLLGAGAYGAATTVSGSVTGASANSVASATANVGAISEGGVALTTAVKSVKFNLNANPRQLKAVGNKFPIGINLGSFEITGTIEAYFEDLVLFNKCMNHTAAALAFTITDAAGHATVITITNLKYTSAKPVGAGLNQDVMVALDFTAINDATTTSMMQVDLLT